ncbi:MAG: hypothetical protein KAS32_13030 [Candidatus Peribacteraceae bacterium]|nr:hypothetical protein [Candidatus Peribacteraceae bacterium]
MKVIVAQGTVRMDDREYKVGESLELSEDDAKAMILSGAVEKVSKVKPEPKSEKKEEKPKEAKSETEPKPEDEAAPEAEPSMDWTAKEILDHGVAKGVKGLDKEGITKKEMLALIKAELKEKGGEKE